MQLVAEGNGHKVYYTVWDKTYTVYVAGGPLVGCTTSREVALAYTVAAA